jgi:hypothetical protein
LKNKIYLAASLIQKIVRKYLSKKKFRAALKIQRFYRKFVEKKIEYNVAIETFRKTFFSGRIANFILRKFYWKYHTN